MKIKIIKRIRRNLERNGKPYFIGLLFATLMGVGLWFGTKDDESVTEQTDFGDAMTSTTSKSLGQSSYEEALVLMEEKNSAKGIAIMKRLAPLSDRGETPRGNPKAHVWMAKHLLGDYQVGYIRTFPLKYQLSKPSVAPQVYRTEEVSKQIITHLNHAVQIAPETSDAHLLLSVLDIAMGKRNEGIVAMVKGLAGKLDKHDAFLISMINATTYAGDSLALKEQVWHAFEMAGRDMSKSGKMDFAKRAEYAAYALLLSKDEVVDVVAGRMERDFGDTSKSTTTKELVTSLRMAKHYAKAVRLLDKANTQSDFKPVVEELAKALKYRPDNIDLVEALKLIGGTHPALKPTIKGIIERVGKTANFSDSKSNVLLYVALAAMSEDRGEAESYFEKAMAYNANDSMVILALARLRASQSNPDYAKLEGLMLQAEIAGVDGELNLAHYNELKGMVLLNSGELNKAIAFLEKALPLAEDPGAVHALLASAYQRAGMTKLAESHRSVGK